MNVNKSLTLISYKCMKKGTSRHQRTRKISTFIYKTLHLVRTSIESTDLNFVLHASRNVLSHPFFFKLRAFTFITIQDI